MALQGISGLSAGYDGGYEAARSARAGGDAAGFAERLERALRPDASGAPPAARSGRLPGDYTSGFEGAFTAAGDKAARPSGAARSAAGSAVIDKTSRLYETALEFESYFVKTMLAAMRGSVQKSALSEGQNAFAAKMYEDMLYDELAVSMTKNAGFGLADQVYLELSRSA